MRMASFVHFYRITPADYWALTGAEDTALALYQAEYHKAQRKARG